MRSDQANMAIITGRDAVDCLENLASWTDRYTFSPEPLFHIDLNRFEGTMAPS